MVDARQMFGRNWKTAKDGGLRFDDRILQIDGGTRPERTFSQLERWTLSLAEKMQSPVDAVNVA